MPDQDTPCEAVVILHLPAEFVDQWPHDQGRVDDAPGHHDIGTRRQRLRNRPGAEVGIGADQIMRDRFAGEHVIEGFLAIRNQRQDVVTIDYRDLRRQT